MQISKHQVRMSHKNSHWSPNGSNIKKSGFNFLVHETRLWGSQVLLPCKQLSNFSSGSHSISAAHASFFYLCLFLLPAWDEQFSHISFPYPGSLPPPGFWDPEILVSIIWHLSSYFISICIPPRPLLRHKDKSTSLTGHCWQTKLIPFTFGENQNSTGAWEIQDPCCF